MNIATNALIIYGATYGPTHLIKQTIYYSVYYAFYITSYVVKEVVSYGINSYNNKDSKGDKPDQAASVDKDSDNNLSIVL